jgi:MIP family channel proteins
MFGIGGAAISVFAGPVDGLTAFRPALLFGVGVMVADFAAGPISGAHVNPAVSLALATIRRCPWRRLPVLFAAQYLGSFVGCVGIYGLYYETLGALNSGNLTGFNGVLIGRPVEDVFVLTPAPSITIWGAIGDQILTTGMLVLGILFIQDETYQKTAGALKTLLIGILVMTFLVGFNYNTGAILNPARDLSPRVMLYLFGYPHRVWA